MHDADPKSDGVRRGRLVVIGTGIKPAAHVTLEAREQLLRADKVYYLVADPVTVAFIHALNSTAKSLGVLFSSGAPRYAIYEQIVTTLVEAVRRDRQVCAAFYGHPGVFVFPSHDAVRLVRAEGFEAVMLPGISAEDCLFADLGVDPAAAGCQSFEATDFLVYRHIPSPATTLVLWQVGLIGRLDHGARGPVHGGLALLQNELLRHYPISHPVTLYEAARLAGHAARAETIALGELVAARVSPFSTLLVPPIDYPEADPTMLEMLGMSHPRPRRQVHASTAHVLTVPHTSS